MTIESGHYVPVLKIKRGEKASLKDLGTQYGTRVTPLLEFVERKGEGKASTVELHLDKAYRGLATSLHSFSRCFLDTRELTDEGHDAVDKAYCRAVDANIRFTIVVGISRPQDITRAALEYQADSDGVALRLTRSEFETRDLNKDIPRFLQKYKLDPSHVDLVVDLGPVEDLITDGIIGLTSAFLADVPHHTTWRSLIVSASSFPKSMGVVDRHSHLHADRAEWIAWRDGLYLQRTSLQRLPSFSDCAIQHPSGVEGFDPRKMKMSAAVRYTHEDSWLLIKGESVGKTPARLQYPNLARELAIHRLRMFYAGPSHCSGCSSIRDAANDAPKLGSAEVWRRIGTIHHIAEVVSQIEALPWP